jgi:hypothetical protein
VPSTVPCHVCLCGCRCGACCRRCWRCVRHQRQRPVRMRMLCAASLHHWGCTTAGLLLFDASPMILCTSRCAAHTCIHPHSPVRSLLLFTHQQHTLGLHHHDYCRRCSGAARRSYMVLESTRLMHITFFAGKQARLYCVPVRVPVGMCFCTGASQTATQAFPAPCPALPRRGQWRGIHPDDKDLVRYHEWLRATDGLGAGLEPDSINSPPAPP